MTWGGTHVTARRDPPGPIEGASMSLPVQEALIAFVPAPRVATEVLAGLCQRPPHTTDPPGPTAIRRTNPRHQGEIGLGDAIGWFSRRGLTVSIPLADNNPTT